MTESAGRVDKKVVGYWSPDRRWTWDGRRWSYDLGDDPGAQSDLADATGFTLASMPSAPPAPEVSGDGKFYWDGKRWVPIKESQPLPSKAAARVATAGRRPRWSACLAIAFFPLAAVAISWWGSGHFWLEWLLIPLALLAVGAAAGLTRETSPSRASEPPAVASATPSPPLSSETSLSACVGLAVADRAELIELVRALAPLAAPLGQAGQLTVARWQDASGVRLVFETGGGDDPQPLPSFAGKVHARLRGIRLINDDVAMATVVGEDGESLTSIAVELEQRRLLPRDATVDAVASIVALGTSVSIHRSAKDFGESDASLFMGSADAEHWRLHPDEPPAEYVEHGWQWPRRMVAESFGSFAGFLASAQAQAFALLSATVLTAERRTVLQTGQEIVVAEVRTVGFDLTVCLEGASHPGLPPVGGIISGTVFMVASLNEWHESASEAGT